MLNLYFKGNIGENMGPINVEADPDIKRMIRTDIIDVAVSLIMNPGEGKMAETCDDESSSSVSGADNDVIGSLNLLHRVAGDKKEETLGTVIALKGLRAIPTMGMFPGEMDAAINIMIATLQVQQWLEEIGILSKDPDEDTENMRILVEVVEGKPVARIIEANEDVALISDQPE